MERKVAHLEEECDRLRKELEIVHRQLYEKLEAERNQSYEKLRAQRSQFRKEIKGVIEEKSTLLRQVSWWKGIFKGLKNSVKDRGQKPIDPETLLNILNSLVPEITE